MSFLVEGGHHSPGKQALEPAIHSRPKQGLEVTCKWSKGERRMRGITCKLGPGHVWAQLHPCPQDHHNCTR